MKELILLYAPLGIVGLWRWSVWLWQKILSFRYKPTPPLFEKLFSYSIITPVYNEDPKIFAAALRSWKMNSPDEIIAVIDRSDKACTDIFKKFSANFAGARLFLTDEHGKRPALGKGIKAARSQILALVDSDTVWKEGTARNALSPFLNHDVGGVATRQTVLDPRTLAQKLFAIRLNLRYLHEFPYLSVTGNLLTCLSGRTAFYRRRAIMPIVDEMIFENFLNKRCISGEDKRLTFLVQKGGWKMKYQQDAVVSTPGAPKLVNFFSQNLRWSRNSWRTDIRTFFSYFPWKQEPPLFAYHLFDRAVQPFTLLIGPIYLFIFIGMGYWNLAYILIAWWLISRTIKLFPHLRRNPKDIFIVPFFIIAQYILAILKIYGLFTLDYHSWITRWHKSRIRKKSFLELLPSRISAILVMGGLSFALIQYQYDNLQNSESKQQQAAIAYTEDFSQFDVNAKQQDFQRKRNASKTVSYILRKPDSPNFINWRLNLSPEASKKILAQRQSGFFATPGTKFHINIEDLKNPISADDLDPIGMPLVFYNSYTNTIRLKGKGSVVTIPYAAKVLKSAGITEPLEELSPGEWILRSNLYVSDGVTLVMDKKDMKSLKMKSEPDNFIKLHSYNGSILINGITVTSWDEKESRPDFKYEDGRAYIRAKENGRMDILDSDLGYLGYPRFSIIKGLPETEGAIYGISWKINNSSIGKSVITGIVKNNRIHHNYFGLYTYGATGMVISNNEVYENIQYGIDPHDDSNNLLIENNYVHNNGNHGIIVSKRVVCSTIRGNVSERNRLHGIMLDRQSNYNLVEKNTASENMNGIAIYDSHSNTIKSNIFIQNRFGIRANVNSSNNIIIGNAIKKNERGVFIYNDAKQNLLSDNTIRENGQGVYFKKARENVLFDKLGWNDNKINIKLDDYSRSGNFIRKPEGIE